VKVCVTHLWCYDNNYVHVPYSSFPDGTYFFCQENCYIFFTLGTESTVDFSYVAADILYRAPFHSSWFAVGLWLHTGRSDKDHWRQTHAQWTTLFHSFLEIQWLLQVNLVHLINSGIRQRSTGRGSTNWWSHKQRCIVTGEILKHSSRNETYKVQTIVDGQKYDEWVHRCHPTKLHMCRTGCVGVDQQNWAQRHWAVRSLRPLVPSINSDLSLNVDHFAPYRATTQLGSSPAPQEICQLYNAKGGSKCHYRSCKFAHSCSRCRGSHPVSSCHQGREAAATPLPLLPMVRLADYVGANDFTG
jgi:hypothetical protein